MHVLVIPSWYSSERKKVHGTFFIEQFKALKESGIKVTVAYNEIWPITMIGKTNEKRGITLKEEFGLTTYRYKDYNYFPKNPIMFKSFNKRMDKLFNRILKEQGKVDIIHAHSCFWGGIAANYISKKYNIPLVITEHTSLEHSKYVKDSYKKHIFEAYDGCDKLIAVGNGLKKELSKYTQNPVSVIHNLVNLDLFKIENTEHSGEFRFFSLAYLEEGKGMELLIKAFSKAFKDNKCKLVIGGDGSIKKKLEELVISLGAEDKISFLGTLDRNEVASEMAKCHAFVLASEYETFGVVYIEATANGKPIIATKNGGSEDIVTSTNGLLIENEEKYLIEALQKMKNNIHEYDATKIRNECIERYSKYVIIDQIIRVYKELI
ncbi:glycosyltransferase [Clostridium sp. 'White wine YQ']|uniref:glycosyltransferase n=1 Tax=Clostridium sp. 'White wine YQ' TaxID=3027474 RepID=UPI0023661DDE|nr:glycosyltransferase [Clostridium sp. 'White wine YQ']MDD7793985.1 glycosyltransferase [Clostridium sp. 'White wine YQ']